MEEDEEERPASRDDDAVRIRSPLSSDEVLERLRRQDPRERFFMMGLFMMGLRDIVRFLSGRGPGMRVRLTGHRLRAWWLRPLGGTLPQLLRAEVRDAPAGGTVIEGRFSTHPGTVVFLIFWSGTLAWSAFELLVEGQIISFAYLVAVFTPFSFFVLFMVHRKGMSDREKLVAALKKEVEAV